MRKKARALEWHYRQNGKKHVQQMISHYANPDFVSVVEESSKEPTSNGVPTVKKTLNDKRKQTGN